MRTQINFFKENIFEITLVLSLLITRITWGLFAGVDPIDFSDAPEYLELSERVLNGNFNFDLYRFVRPPAYPIQIAITKVISGEYWLKILLIENILFSIGTALLIYMAVNLIFNNKKMATVTCYIFCFHFPFFFYVPSISTESSYAFFFVGTIYFFQKILIEKRIRWLFLFSISFYIGTAYKAFHLAILPIYFLTLLYFGWKYSKIYYKYSVYFLIAYFMLSAPFALYNLKVNKQYILSSNGASYLFLNGNSEPGYLDAVKFSILSEKEKYLVKNFSEHGAYFFGKPYEDALKMNAKDKQKEFLKISLKWIKENPAKFIELKIKNAWRFLLPGKSPMHSPFHDWLLSFLVSLPLYIFSYLGIGIMFKRNRELFNKNLWLLALVAANAFSLIFLMYTYRYKVYGAELIYLFYAGHGALFLLKKCNYLQPN